MSATIMQRRIEKLERSAGDAQERITFIVRFITTNGVESINRARFNETVISRAQDETEEEFIDRVKGVTEASAGDSCVRVIVFHADD